MPGRVTVDYGTMTAGYAIGHLNQSYRVPKFEITSEPIRVRDYRACVNAGACTRPSIKTVDCEDKKAPLPRASTYGMSGGDELPVTCTSPKQAAQYCAWVGGALPDEHQWLVAARGPLVHRWAWGDTAPTCQQHPMGSSNNPSTVPSTVQSKDPSKDQNGCAVGKFDPLQVWATGTHTAGAALTHVHDVLLTPSELLRTTPDTISSACGGSSSEAACLVTSLAPGGIDGALRIEMNPPTDNPSTENSPTEKAAAGKPPTPYPTFSFRCVWTDG
jgi:hypothetical protein